MSTADEPHPVEGIVNLLVGRRFNKDGKDYVVTWDDSVYLRATPLDCPTGLTSITFLIDDIGRENMREG